MPRRSSWGPQSIDIEDEKELQILGCGRRVVTCQFQGIKVLLHAGGQTATMERKPSVVAGAMGHAQWTLLERSRGGTAANIAMSRSLGNRHYHHACKHRRRRHTRHDVQALSRSSSARRVPLPSPAFVALPVRARDS
jgi:hypothetical protein